MIFNNKPLNQYDLKFTMGKLLQIERERALNPLSDDLLKDISAYQFKIDTFKKNEWKPFLQVLEDTKSDGEGNIDESKLNLKEKEKVLTLRKELRRLEEVKSSLEWDYWFQLLSLFAGEKIIEDESIDVNCLLEFAQTFTKKRAQFFTVKKKNKEGSDSGK